MIHQHLFRKSGSRMSGKPQSIVEWYVVVEGDTYTTYSGKKGGKMTPKATKAKAKNVGRANETTPEQQALIEAEAAWTHKVQRDLYKVDLDDGMPPLYLEPMLALDATKHGHRLRWGQRHYGTQPKLNGVRVTAYHTPFHDVTLTSREGMRYDVQHVQEALTTLMSPGQVWDGELDLGNEYELGDVTGALKPGSENHHLLKFHVFDAVHKNHPFTTRMQSVINAMNDHRNHPIVKIVPAYSCSSFEHMDTQHDFFVDQGYEGIIIRDLDAPYDYGQKGEAMFKYKKFQDQEFKILDVVPDKDGTGGLFILETDNGEFGDLITEPTFTCRPKGTNEQRLHVLENPGFYVGKRLTVRFSQRLKSGVPEFNRGITKDGMIAVRDYE